MTRVYRFSQLLAALGLLLLPHFQFAQAPSSEHVYQKPEPEVQKSLQQLHSSIDGRLPILDGFVDSDQPLDGYSQGYYRCVVQISPAGSGGTLVRVTAKITAWYAGSGATAAGYQVLPSNGRLEGDFLGRLDEALDGTASAQGSPAAPATAAPTPASGSLPEANAAGLPNSSKPALLGTAPPPLVPRGVVIPPYNPTNTMSPPSAGEDLLSPRGKLEEAEQRKDLQAEIQSLEEIQRNQVRPSNLAVVKLAGAPVLSTPRANARTIFKADAGDEFEVLGKQENWVHVRIAGPSRGWIKSAELDLAGVAEPRKSTADRSDAPVFHISRGETKPFGGQWEPLHGKTVRIIWVESASGSAMSSAQQKRSFAKSVFLKTYQQLASGNEPVEGVVIVFDSADGGQISATLPTLKQLQTGSLSEALFWKRCSLDPADFLEEPSRTTGGSL